MTALAEAGQAAKLLADRGLASGIGHPADGCRAAGDPLVARDAYGSRFLLVAPFGYDGEAPDHWYAWDIDSCWIVTVAGAGAFGSAEDALAEWQHAVGPAAGTSLSPSTPETTARLLAPCLDTGPLSDILQGSEPRELIREYYRLRRRARSLIGATAAGRRGLAAATTPARCARRSWTGTQHGTMMSRRTRPTLWTRSSRSGDRRQSRGALALRLLTAPDRDDGAPDP